MAASETPRLPRVQRLGTSARVTEDEPTWGGTVLARGPNGACSTGRPFRIGFWVAGDSVLPRSSARSGGVGWGRGEGAGARRFLELAPVASAAPPGGGAVALVLQTEWTLQPRQWCLAGTGFALARGFSGCGPTSVGVAFPC